MQKIVAGETPKPAACAADARPEFVAPDCCPSCTPAEMAQCDPPLTACAEGVRPTKDAAGCPTCYFSGDLSAICTREKVQACAAPPECDVGVLPTRGDDCCPTCQIPKPECTETQLTTCKASIAGLPECTAETDKSTVFDAATCCVTCKRPEGDRTGDKQCTVDQFKTCMESIAVCEAGEQMVLEPSQCCASCKRPERIFNALDVATCLSDRPACAADEKPAWMLGERCATCKPAPPVCSSCADPKVCVRTKAGPKCVSKKARKLKIKAKAVAMKAKLEGISKEEVREMVLEMVERYCENPDHAVLCEKKDALRDGLRCKATKNANGETEVELEVPDETGVYSRSFQTLSEGGFTAQANTSGDLLDAAMQDADAASDFTVTVETEAEAGGEANSASTTAFSAFSAFVLFVGAALEM